MNSVLRVLAYLRKYPRLACGQLFCVIFSTLFLLAFPNIAQHIVDKVIPRNDVKELVSFTLLALGAFFMREFLNSMRILINNQFEQKVIFDIRSDLHNKLQRLPLTWFNNRRTGDIMTRVGEDVTAMERILIDGIEQGLAAFIQVLGFGIYLFYLNTMVGAWACAPIPFLFMGAWLYSRNARSRYKEQRESTSAMNSLLHDNIAGIRQVKSFTAEEAEHTRFQATANKVRLASLRLMRYWAAYNPSMSFFQMCGYTLVLGFGGYAVMQEELQAGEYLGFFVSLSLFYEPIGRLHQLNQMALSSRAAADRVFEILDTPDELNATDGKTLPLPVRGEVQMKNVSFSYGDAPTLSDVTIDAQPGQTIALVGTTGAGKSTIVNLLCRFYEYENGLINIDGQDIRDLSKTSLRSAIGYVTQEAFLFNGSVRENMLLAKPDATEEHIYEAIDAARAGDFVRRLKDGLDTNIGERGVKLSGGEKQRLSIARALLKDPPILLLDEATASVDSQTEKQIQGALDRLMENRTAFVIAHRLSTIQNADRIYVLELGKVIEAGTHHQLLAQNGRYAELSHESFLAEQDRPLTRDL